MPTARCDIKHLSQHRQIDRFMFLAIILSQVVWGQQLPTLHCRRGVAHQHYGWLTGVLACSSRSALQVGTYASVPGCGFLAS